jgi:hypothetical protein
LKEAVLSSTGLIAALLLSWMGCSLCVVAQHMTHAACASQQLRGIHVPHGWQQCNISSRHQSCHSTKQFTPHLKNGCSIPVSVDAAVLFALMT